MRKLFFRLLAISILVFTAGCSNTANTVEKNISTESPTKAVNLIGDPNSDVKGSTSKEWPTEEWNISTPEEQGLDSRSFLIQTTE
jgi:hypothetical protein